MIAVQEPLFSLPATWTPPASVPADLAGAVALGVDCETHDPNLPDKGPGGIRGDGKVVGVSLSDGERSFYFPLAHAGGGNVKDPEAIMAQLRDLLNNYKGYIIGAHLPYDLEWLWTIGIEPKAKCIDIQIAEPLLDEELEGGYSLNRLCLRHLGQEKDEALLRDAASVYGFDPKRDLWKFPARYVGPYAEFDAKAPVLIFQKQLPLLKSAGLLDIFELESKLLPLLWQMRKRGVPVDMAGAKALGAELMEEEIAHFKWLRNEAGLDDLKINIWSTPDLVIVADRLKIDYPRTDKGNPSFPSSLLENHKHPVMQRIFQLRTVNRLRTTFVETLFKANSINGRIHPNWRQLVSDDGGARTGRMAANNPNLMQIPRDPRLRALFVAEEGRQWMKADFSSQEPRLLIHYANACSLPGAADAKANLEAGVGFYNFIMELCHVDKPTAKILALGRMYGMGLSTFAETLNCTEDEARVQLEQFDKSVPFVRMLSESVNNRAASRGWITTIGGRRRNFNKWEPSWSKGWQKPLPYAEAKAKWGTGIRRAYCNKALNSLIQGSAADMTKTALVQIYEKMGLLPYLAVHDELDYPVENNEQATEIKVIMENAIKLKVPVVADVTIGRGWK